VRLFVERAQSHKPAFTLNEREAPAVAELVARLEGIPLALELAAARVRSLTVADINKRLGERYKLLTGGSRVLQERQQTLRALVDWSYEH
jgi:predicted ATPase